MNISAIKMLILNNKEKSAKIAAISLIIIIALVIYLGNNFTKSEGVIILDTAETDIPEILSASAAAEEKEEPIVIDVAGAVNFPGVVSLPSGSRVNDAVEKAGGLRDDADTSYVNLAAKLQDGDKVYIPNGQEQEQKPGIQPAGIITNKIANNSQTASAGAADTLININTANSGQLQVLNGVGPATAQKIIDYRESNGVFKKIEDIMKVSGIGDKTFAKFKDKITV